MSPPELARDAPGADVVHPLQVDAGGTVGNDADLAVADDAGGFLRQFGGIDEPLVGDERFDGDAGALGVSDVVEVSFGAEQVAVCFEVLSDQVAGVVAVESDVDAALGGHAAVPIDDADRFELVAFADFEVQLVVAGRDFERPGAEFGVDGGVGDDWDQAVESAQGEADVAAMVGLPAFVVGVDGDGDVGGDGFGAGGGDHDAVGQFAPLFVDEGIADVPELAFGFAVFDFDVGDGGQHLGVPVDDAFAAVDALFAEEVDEGLADGAAGGVVEGEDAAVPVAGSAHPPGLIFDPGAGASDPVPDAVDEGFAAEIASVDAFAGELLFDHTLGGDAGVVAAGQPESGMTEHAAPADEGVFDGQGDGVAEMEDAGHVGRGHDHREGVEIVAVVIVGIGRGEPAAPFPEVVDRGFGDGGVVGFGQCGLGRLGHGRAPGAVAAAGVNGFPLSRE